ncbi:hypothetical protein [Mucilaginibacter sp.]|uniref:hypothetical protein n=1 Tax=Mucilaginibacter sp. TaxID=1882438 RepID=UPI003B00C6EC
MKKSYYWIVGILLFLIITNPSVKAFKDYLGNTSYLNLRRENNFFVFSKYRFREKSFFAIAGNFFNITYIKKPLPLPVKKPIENSISTTTDTFTNYLPPPPPKRNIGILSLPYKSRIYLALSDNVPGFHTDYDTFNLATQDKGYVLGIYKILKKNINGFNRSEKEFLKLITTQGEPKDEYGIPIKSKY